MKADRQLELFVTLSHSIPIAEFTIQEFVDVSQTPSGTETYKHHQKQPYKMLAVMLITLLTTVVGAIPYTAPGTLMTISTSTAIATTTTTPAALELRDSNDFAISPEAAGAAMPTTTPAAAIAAATEEPANNKVEAAAAAATTAPSAPPAEDPEVDADLAAQGYAQVTYYSCVAYAKSTHCGWHEEVVHSGAVGRQGGEQVALLAAAVVLGGMLVNGVGW